MSPVRAFLLTSTLALATAVGPATAAPEARPGQLRVSVSPANGAPFVLYDEQGRFRGGLARDIMDHLAARLMLTPEYLNLPRARVEAWLRADRLDAACFLAPAWVKDAAELRWSPPLFQIQQVIVGRPGAPAITRPEDLFGKRVGTMLNYVYPELGLYFADRRIRRSDSPSLASNIAKLERGRIDVFLFDDIQTLYAITQDKLPADSRIDPLWAAKSPVYCAFGPAFTARTPGWQEELRRLADSGQIQRWIGAYTGGRRIIGSGRKYALPER